MASFDGEYDGKRLLRLSGAATAVGLITGGDWPQPRHALEGLVLAASGDFSISYVLSDGSQGIQSFKKNRRYKCVKSDVSARYLWVELLRPTVARNAQIDAHRAHLTHLGLPQRPERDIRAKWAEPLREEGLGQAFVLMCRFAGGSGSQIDWPYLDIEVSAEGPTSTGAQMVDRVLEILRDIRPDLAQALVSNWERRRFKGTAPLQSESTRIGGAKDVLDQAEGRLRSAILNTDLELGIATTGQSVAVLRRQILVMETALHVMQAVHKASEGFEESEVLLDLVADWVETDLASRTAGTVEEQVLIESLARLELDSEPRTRRAVAAYIGSLLLDQEWGAFH